MRVAGLLRAWWSFICKDQGQETPQRGTEQPPGPFALCHLEGTDTVEIQEGLHHCDHACNPRQQLHKASSPPSL